MARLLKSYKINLPDKENQEHLRLEWLDQSIQGQSGQIQASFPANLQNPLAKAWVDAFKTLAYSTITDPHSGDSIGAYNNLVTVDPRSKTRSYAASAYGTPALQKPNVQIVTEAIAQQIIFDTAGPSIKAAGVKAVIEGQTHSVTAHKEVIISTGVLNTPKLLELSGIENHDILPKNGIPVVIDNPNVGEKIQDHLMTGISLEVTDGIVTSDALLRQKSEAIQAAMQLYTELKTGPIICTYFA